MLTTGFAFTNSEQYFEQELTLVVLPWQAKIEAAPYCCST